MPIPACPHALQIYCSSNQIAERHGNIISTRLKRHSFECRGGSAGIRNLYSYVTSSGDIRYDNRSYAAIVQRKSRVRGQISAPSVPSCVCANELSFKIYVFQVVKSPQSRRDRCYCYRLHVRTLQKPGPA